MVPAVLTRLRAELRARWKAWGGVALLIGLAGGAVLTTAAGARRTDTAYARYLRSTKAADVLVSAANTGLTGYYDAVAHLPGVAASGAVVGLQAGPLGKDGQPELGSQMVASVDGRYGNDVDHAKLLSGRGYRLDRADEVVADVAAARRYHLHAGSLLRAAAVPGANGPDLAHAVPLQLRVVGIVVSRTNVVPISPLDRLPQFGASPALLARFGPEFHAFDGMFLRLHPGTSADAVSRQAQALAARFPDTGGQAFVANQASQVAKVGRAIRPQAVALALFALLTAVTAFFVVGQVLTRQLFLASSEHPTLRALGMSRNQLMLLGLGDVVGVAVAGALFAVVVALASSPIMPIGPARLAEPSPGLSPDWVVLSVGIAAIVAVLLLRAAWPAWRLAGARTGVQGTVELSGVDEPSRVVGAVTRAGAPASAAVGIRLALEPGRGRTSVPVRSAMGGTALAIVAVVAALTFSANLVRLVDTPRLYGQTWDVVFDFQFRSFTRDDAAKLLGPRPEVAGWSLGSHGDIAVAGKPVPVIGVEQGRGPLVFPTLLDGHAAVANDEIVLGTKTLRDAHLHVGDTVNVVLNQQARTMRVVGRAVFPDFGRGSFNPTDLGDGAAVNAGLISQPESDNPAAIYNFVLVRIAGGQNHRATTARFLSFVRHANACPPDQQCVLTSAQRPADIRDYARVRGTPIALAAVLAFLALATLAHLLVTSTRRRRRDLAVLKTLGFVRGQVSAAVAWQATTLVLVALLVGIPVGAALGRWLWGTFAGRLGVPSDPRVPLLTLALAVPIALAIANLLAAGPGWVAGRLKPAPVLRTE